MICVVNLRETRTDILYNYFKRYEPIENKDQTDLCFFLFFLDLVVESVSEPDDNDLDRLEVEGSPDFLPFVILTSSDPPEPVFKFSTLPSSSAILLMWHLKNIEVKISVYAPNRITSTGYININITKTSHRR